MATGRTHNSCSISTDEKFMGHTMNGRQLQILGSALRCIPPGTRPSPVGCLFAQSTTDRVQVDVVDGVQNCLLRVQVPIVARALQPKTKDHPARPYANGHPPEQRASVGSQCLFHLGRARSFDGGHEAGHPFIIRDPSTGYTSRWTCSGMNTKATNRQRCAAIDSLMLLARKARHWSLVRSFQRL